MTVPIPITGVSLELQYGIPVQTVPHIVSSFDYKVTNKNIRDALKRRSLLDNTIQVAMPFVKATATLEHKEYLGEGNIGFSVGLQGILEDVRYEDIYSNRDAGVTHPLVGYTYTADGGNRKIYASPPNSEVSAINGLFDQGADLYSSAGNFVRMPPTGITRMTIGRNKNGLLAVGELDISVPTLSQLEILHRTFLVPGMGMVLEWGQQFSVGGGINTPVLTRNMFPWYDRDALKILLTRLGRKEVGLEEILRDYVYPSEGQYMWMFGRVANFSTKANTDGSFNCRVRIVGPSEDSWAYSTLVTVVPPQDNSGKICVENTNSVQSYFKNTNHELGSNFKSLLDDVLSGNVLTDWKTHVIKIDNGNHLSEGENTEDKSSKNPNVSSVNFEEDVNAYFISWRFFVNIVLNHPDYGILQMFKKAGLSNEELNKIVTLRPYSENNAPLLDVQGSRYLEDELEPYVGYNKYLRSSDPSVLIINNSVAEELAQVGELEQKYQNIIKSTNDSKVKPDPDKRQDFKNIGDFGRAGVISPTEEGETQVGEDKALLSTGVWLNHRAIIECMVGADTLLRGVTNLLDRMNAATSNYWKLTLDSLESLNEGDKYQYIVADANYRSNSETAKKLLEDIHVFNKYVRKLGDNLYGSDVLSCDVDLSLPKRLFAQIATLGLVRRDDLIKAGVTESDPAEVRCKNPLISDANETLREMFSILSVSAENSEYSPDLTIKWGNRVIPESSSGICRGQPTNTTAQASENSTRLNDKTTDALPAAPAAEESVNSAEEQRNSIAEITQGKCPVPKTSNIPSGVNPNDILDCSRFGVGTARNLLCEGGCVNGDLPPDAFDPEGIIGADGQPKKVLKTVKNAFTSLQERYEADTENQLLPNRGATGFRTLADQARQSSAAGTLESYHTWGMGLDVPLGAASWLRQNADSNLWDVVVESDHVHLEYVGALDPDDAEDIKTKCTSYKSQTSVSRIQTEEVSSEFDEVYKEIGNRQYIQDASARSIVPGFVPTIPSEEDLIARGKQTCAREQRAIQAVKQAETVLNETKRVTSSAERILRKFNALNIVFPFVELTPELMIASIRCDADNNKSNAFGASPGALSLSADITLPGINGFRVGELFWIDRIPSFYKAFGAFQILSIEDEITIDGWNTKIHSWFNYLGNAWKSSVEELLSSRDSSVISDITAPSSLE